MKKQNIVKGASVMLIATIMILSSVVVSAHSKEKNEVFEKNIDMPLTRDVLFEDGFETYDDFSINFPPWTLIDVDGDPSFGHSAYVWPNQWDPQSFIIFNPSMTSPPMTEPEAQPHSGSKFAACFNANNAGYINDDWMISPLIDAADFDDLTVWAKSFSSQYNYDQFEVGISTTDTSPSSFDIITSPIQPGHAAWEEHVIDLNAYDGSAIYIGFHCISVDAWFLMIDDISVTGVGGPVPEPDMDCSGELDFVDVTPGDTVTGTITVENNGEENSRLDWEIQSFPEWGEWTFDPESGFDLLEGDSVEISVDIVAPDVEEETFEGEVVLVNSNDDTDTCTIQVSLVTPVSQSYPFLELLAQRFPILAKILAMIL